ncbi:MAG: transcription-repair coupling factor, partial [Terriglobales bacterium]
MILPFVRDLFADVENLPGFTRAASHLKNGMGGISVSGLTPTAKALLIALLSRATAKPLIVVVPSNRAAEELQPSVEAFAELAGALRKDAEIVALPAPDVLPYEGLSPHPEIQEQRAAALWRIAQGNAAIAIVPVTSAAMRLGDPEFYFMLARPLRKSDTVEIDGLVQWLNTVGYTAVDVVEMPGEYAVRGGILDVYGPEMERPVRLELFGDEVESIRKFDPATQRSSGALDEIILLPLTETPV